MEKSIGKIIAYLMENRHLDLEAPDIAFHLKQSEKSVEVTLKKLAQQGLVTARQNEYGRVYWYALPSSGDTTSASIGTVTSKALPRQTIEDEVDIADLQKKTPPVDLFDDEPALKRGKSSPVFTIVAMLVTLCIVGAGAWHYQKVVDKKISEVTAQCTAQVATMAKAADVVAVRDSLIEKIAGADGKISELTTTIDSLQSTVNQLGEANKKLARAVKLRRRR